MLGSNAFFYDLNTKYTILFASLFTDLKIPRYDANGAMKEILDVPLAWAAREKVMQRLEQDPNIDRDDAVTLPRMSFWNHDIGYDRDRKLNSVGRVTVEDNTTLQISTQFTPVPYDLKYTLWIYSHFQKDVNAIIEQILPFFRPEFVVKAELIPELNVIDVNIPVILDSCHVDDSYDGKFQDRRVLVWELEFTLKGAYYGPILNSGLIKFVNVSFYDATLSVNIDDAVGNTPAIDRITLQPGELANGSPTTNVHASIPYANVNASDTWGFAYDIYGDISEFPNG